MLRPALVVSLVALTVACSSSGQHPAGSGTGGTDAATEASAGNGGGGGSSGAPDAAADTSLDAAADAGADADASLGDASPSDASDSSVTDASDGSVTDADAAIDYDAEPVDGSTCGAVVQQRPIEGALHVPPCSPVTYMSNPPSSGNHYPIWADYKTYTQPVPRGFWVHNLEHGAVVITYNCPGGCASEIAQAQSVIDSYSDPVCLAAAGVPRRIVMTPDPLLDVRWAASSWGWTLKASCFEPAVFLQFIQDHYNHAPENVCNGYWDFQPDGGSLVLPCSDAGADGG